MVIMIFYDIRMYLCESNFTKKNYHNTFKQILNTLFILLYVIISIVINN